MLLSICVKCFPPRKVIKANIFLNIKGGPTAETRASLNLSTQYWTSLGNQRMYLSYISICSIPLFPGYGREYREQLLGEWGIVDVNDCCSCARFLVILAELLN